jgi:site-specific DNA-methyltransferase (adenine-specific)
MKFDVIVGNPPYQMETGGGVEGFQAMPIYHKFIQQAKKMNPRFMSMIIPSRWFVGGMGLDSFREEMLHDTRLRKIHDFPVASDCFAGVQIKGGVCYFLWDRDNSGYCEVTTHRGNECGKPISRPLLEAELDSFVRYNEAVDILHKIWNFHENKIDTLVSAQMPFGLSSAFRGHTEKEVGDILIYCNNGITYCSRTEISKNTEYINCDKVFISKAGSGSDAFPHSILSVPFYGTAGTACTETYVTIGPFSDKNECDNVISYIKTRFFRFLVMLMKPTQNALRKVYSLVPLQDFSEAWTDEKLYAKYGLTQEEIAFIESMIRPMEVDNGVN